MRRDPNDSDEDKDVPTWINAILIALAMVFAVIILGAFLLSRMM